MNFPVNGEKAVQAAARLIEQSGHPIDYLRLCKLAYLADRRSILVRGEIAQAVAETDLPFRSGRQGLFVPVQHRSRIRGQQFLHGAGLGYQGITEILHQETSHSIFGHHADNRFNE